jgi:hypothetical protein
MTRLEAEKKAQALLGEMGDCLSLGAGIFQIGFWEKGPQGFMIFRVCGRGPSWEAALRNTETPST